MNRWDQKKTSHNTVDFNTTILIIILNVNNINPSKIRQRLSDYTVYRNSL